MEHVHNDVHEIEQRPPAGSHALGVVGMAPVALNRFQHPFRQCANVRVGGAGGDDEDVGGVAHPAQVQDDDILRLVGFESLDGSPEVPKRLLI